MQTDSEAEAEAKGRAGDVTPLDVRKLLTETFESWRLETAGRRDHPLRWSGSDLATDLEPVVLGFIREAVEAEREACAKLVEEEAAVMERDGRSAGGEWGFRIRCKAAEIRKKADAIRARSAPPAGEGGGT